MPVRARQFLPQIYVPSQDILPKANKCMAKVNMQRKIRSAGSFSGLVLELKRIIKHKRWNLTWIDMCLILFGLYIIENGFWKIRKIKAFSSDVCIFHLFLF